jgi:acetyltransferase-like isoleucine patch superfamily enzyme
MGGGVIHDSAFIHEKAHVDGSTIGARSKVWQFASVTGGCIIGSDCGVSPFAMLHGSRYGDRVRISGGVKAGPGFLVGNDVFLGPNVVLGNDLWPVADKVGFDTSKFDGSRWAIIVEDGVGIGANTVILPGVVIGMGSMIAAGSVVTRSVSPNSLWVNGEFEPIKRRPPRMRFARRWGALSAAASAAGG